MPTHLAGLPSAPPKPAQMRLTLLKTLFFFCLFVFLGPYPQHMEVPRLGVQAALQLPACTTASATADPSHVCNLHHSSRQRQILNSLKRPGIEPATSWFLVGFASAAPQQVLSSQETSPTAERATRSVPGPTYHGCPSPSCLHQRPERDMMSPRLPTPAPTPGSSPPFKAVHSA